MKKVCLLLLGIFFLVGCESKEEQPKITYDNSYYQVVSPYQTGVGSYTLKSYDKEEVESMMMNLSMKYFSPNNSYYEEGQYLDNERLKELLTALNETDKTLSDGITKPVFISSIYEQNYVASNNNLKGISLALILSTEQSYQKDGLIYTETLKEEDVINFAKDKASYLLKYIRDIDELKDTKVVVGVYVENKNQLKGSLPYVGQTTNYKINLENVNYHYELLDGNYAMQNDMQNYNNMDNLKKVLKEYTNVYGQGIGLYQNNQLLKLNLTIHASYLKNAQILDISKNISTVLNGFQNGVIINVSFVSNNQVKAVLIKDGQNIKTHILEG